MNATTRWGVFGVACVLLAGAAVACERPGKTHTLKFKIKTNECVEKVQKDADETDADTIHVCETDVVKWKVNGKAKSVVFDDKKTPFTGWHDSGFKDTEIEGTVRQGTAGQEFKYSVKIQGLTCVYDPRIIVDP